MERYARGDDLAFGAVHDAVAPRLFALAVRALGERTLAEDVVQQTLLNIHRARGAFVPGSPLMPWAYAIARRLVVDVIRRRKRELRLVEQGGSPERLPCPATPDQELAASEIAGSLRVAVAALPGSQQTVLQLRREGMALSTIAAALGTTVTAVKLRLHRATSSLKGALAGLPGQAASFRASASPSRPAAKQPSTVAARFASARAVSPFSSSTDVSKLNDEYVVSPPRKPVASASRRFGGKSAMRSDSSRTSAIANEPARFTSSVA